MTVYVDEIEMETQVCGGCDNCYAMSVAHRFGGAGQPYEGLTRKIGGRGQWTGFIRLAPHVLDQPLRWVKPRHVFVNSMSDLFHPDIPFEFIADVFAVMACTTRHTYQVLTKRPERMRMWFDWAASCPGPEHTDPGWPEIVDPLRVWPQWTPYRENQRGGYDNCGPAWPLENVWLGVSVEDQATADERIPPLLDTPAAVRFLSCEPLLRSIDLEHIWLRMPSGGESLTNVLRHHPIREAWPAIDWVIAGGESGPGARPMHPDWVRSLRDQCVAAGVPFFFKQWGEWVDEFHPEANTDSQGTSDDFMDIIYDDEGRADDYRGVAMCHVGKKAAGRQLDGRTWDEVPT